MICSCGHPSKEECHDLFQKTIEKEFANVLYGKNHRLNVDAYALQHPDQYMKSSKSYAAHLTGACVFFEYDNDRDLLRTLQQWLSGNKQLDKPPLLDFFGDLRITHVIQAETPPDHARLVTEWAASAWEAYAPQHKVARQWVEQAKREYVRKVQPE